MSSTSSVHVTTTSSSTTTTTVTATCGLPTVTAKARRAPSREGRHHANPKPACFASYTAPWAISSACSCLGHTAPTRTVKHERIATTTITRKARSRSMTWFNSSAELRKLLTLHSPIDQDHSDNDFDIYRHLHFHHHNYPFQFLPLRHSGGSVRGSFRTRRGLACPIRASKYRRRWDCCDRFQSHQPGIHHVRYRLARSSRGAGRTFGPRERPLL